MTKSIFILLFIIASVPIITKSLEFYSLNKSIKDSNVIFAIVQNRKLQITPSSSEKEEATAFGLSFFIPVELEHFMPPEFINDNLIMFAHKNEEIDKSIIISRKLKSISLFSQLKEQVQTENLLELFGPHLNSEYELRKFLYSINPDELSILSSENEFKRATIALVLRGQDINTKYLAAFDIPNSALKGFQFGTPNEGGMLMVYIYDQDLLYSINFEGFLQPEIDNLLASLKTVD